MFVWIQLMISMFPIVPLIYFSFHVNRFWNVLKKGSCIKEKNMSFNGIKDFSPKKIRRELESDSSIEKKIIDETIKAYQNVLLAFCIYISFWILYLILIVVRIVWLCNHYRLLNPQEGGSVSASIVMSVLVSYWLFLTPIFELFNLNKLSNLGYITWKFLQDILDKCQKKFHSIIKYFCQILVSFILMYVYIFFVKKVLNSVQIKINFWNALIILMLYQYMILKLLSNIIIFIAIKINKIQYLERYADDNILYLFLKNSTYLSMVLVYATAVDEGKAEAPFIAAIGILFLIDTFFDKEKEIQEKIGKK